MNRLRGVFGFFTILPLSRAGTIEDIARAGYLLPLVAVVLGSIEGLAGWGCERLFGQPVAAAAILAMALLLTGFHHLDGLADFGDALMVHGDAARRIEVLKDRTLGIGAAGAVLLTCLISWAALLQLFISSGQATDIIWSLIAVEISARLCMLVVIAVSAPSHEGSGSVFLSELKGWRSLLGIALSASVLAALAMVLSPAGVIMAGVAVVFTGLLMAAAGRHWFGGAGGDLLGTAVELGRMAALLGLVATLL